MALDALGLDVEETGLPQPPAEPARSGEEAAAMLRLAGIEVREPTEAEVPPGAEVPDLCAYLDDEHAIAGYC